MRLLDMQGTPSAVQLAASQAALVSTPGAQVITGDSGNNTLTSISGGIAGDWLILRFADAKVTITTAAAKLLGNVSFVSAINKVLFLFFDGANWLEVSRTAQAGIDANTPIVADVTGNVTGNLTGNVTGNVTGDVTGNQSGATSVNSTSTSSPLHKQTGANGQIANIQSATVVLSAFSGGTKTATNLIPAGAVVLGVTIRVTTLITSGDGSVAMTIGDGTTADLWGSGIVFTLGTTTTGADFKAGSTPKNYPAATSVVFTATGGTFSAGAVRITVHYVSFTAATS